MREVVSRFRFRLLPLTIFGVVLMLGARLGDVWEGDAEAQEAAPAASAVQQGAAPSEGAAVAPAAAGAPEGPAGLDHEVEDFSDSELEVLQNLSARRDELQLRARELDMRENLLRVAEQRLDEKIAWLDELRAIVEAHLDAYDQQTDANMRRLVKIYESMKPKDAARIFAELELSILLDVISRMREQKSASILAAMDPIQAKTVTSELALRNQLPEPGS